MPTFKDIKAKNAQFAATARENAGKPRIRTPKNSSAEDAGGTEESFEAREAKKRKGRQIVKPAKKDRLASMTSGGRLRNNKVALGLIVFVVIGGVFFELMRLFL